MKQHKTFLQQMNMLMMCQIVLLDQSYLWEMISMYAHYNYVLAQLCTPNPLPRTGNQQCSQYNFVFYSHNYLIQDKCLRNGFITRVSTPSVPTNSFPSVCNCSVKWYIKCWSLVFLLWQEPLYYILLYHVIILVC